MDTFPSVYDNLPELQKSELHSVDISIFMGQLVSPHFHNLNPLLSVCRESRSSSHRQTILCSAPVWIYECSSFVHGHWLLTPHEVERWSGDDAVSVTFWSQIPIFLKGFNKLIGCMRCAADGTEWLEGTWCFYLRPCCLSEGSTERTAGQSVPWSLTSHLWSSHLCVDLYQWDTYLSELNLSFCTALKKDRQEESKTCSVRETAFQNNTTERLKKFFFHLQSWFPK